jgi:hypothetical protein
MATTMPIPNGIRAFAPQPFRHAAIVEQTSIKNSIAAPPLKLSFFQAASEPLHDSPAHRLACKDYPLPLLFGFRSEAVEASLLYMNRD